MLFYRFLGDGSYGKVNLVKWNINDQQYALKILDKQRVVKYDKVESVKREKDIMFGFDHPNITRLEMTFQDEASLFFLLEYAPNGDLAGFIKRQKRLPLPLIKFYACEIINALEWMRSYNVVHRDMKPENILLDNKGHVKITDFGDSKVINPKEMNAKILSDRFNPGRSLLDTMNEPADLNFDEIVNGERGEQEVRNSTFVGTPLYISPEMLNHNIAWFGSDLWALGCILYQWATGAPPFNGMTETQLYSKITSRKIYFPDFLDSDLKDLIDKLLQVHPNDRLGAEIEEGKNTLDDLKAHKFFENMEFKDIHKRSAPIPKNERLTMELNRKAKQVPDDLNDVDSDENTSPDHPKISKAQSAAVFDKNYKTEERDKDQNATIKKVDKQKQAFDMKMLNPIKDYDDKNTIKETVVEKRNKWYFYQDRTLKLTKDLRLMYYK